MEEAGFSKRPDALLPEYDITFQKSAVFNPCQESLKFCVSGCIVTEVLMFHQIDAGNNKNNRITETTIYTECQVSHIVSSMVQQPPSTLGFVLKLLQDV